mmetsp:Transcript_35185/g.84044  ORF Transcript_35185/g.84044 Transcript_35185/m.84044 type:complete len:244 (+) Transcript_35185:118-849(+)
MYGRRDSVGKCVGCSPNPKVERLSPFAFASDTFPARQSCAVHHLPSEQPPLMAEWSFKHAGAPHSMPPPRCAQCFWAWEATRHALDRLIVRASSTRHVVWLPPGGTWISLHRMFSGSFSSNFACQLPEPQPLTPGDGVGECAGMLPLHLSLPTFHTSAKKGAVFPAGGSLLAGSLPVTRYFVRLCACMASAQVPRLGKSRAWQPPMAEGIPFARAGTRRSTASFMVAQWTKTVSVFPTKQRAL